MSIIKLTDLPLPPKDKTGFPWTEHPTPQHSKPNLPKISIITPSFNQGLYIEETIRSVLLQNYPNLEYIIIDGGSKDETISIIKKYEHWITYWFSEPDDGQSDAINKGLRYATGDIFNWINSDDVYLPNALLSIGYFFSNKDLNVLCGQEYLLYPNGQKILTTGTVICDTLEETIARGHIQQPPTFFRMHVVKQLGGVDTRLHFCMDAELWVNYLTHFGLAGVKKVNLITNFFRMHKMSKTTNAKTVYFQDRFNILVSLFNSLQSVEVSKLIKNDINSNLYFTKHYKFSTSINEITLAIHLIERLFNFGLQYLDWLSLFRLYYFVLKTQPLGWHWRFYAAPLIKIKRLFRPL